MDKEVRVRFAPSPTGPLHIGGVRTALYNYLFARKHGGKMILRIEDTDQTRFVPGAEEYINEALSWLGIEIDEGVREGGEYGPYRQTLRREHYAKYTKQLLDTHRAYIAFDTPEELNAKREAVANFQYDASTRGTMRNSLTMTPEEVDALIAAGTPYVVRFLIEPDRDVVVDDAIRGRVVINSSVLDDKVIYKSAEQLPTYHLANIVDDHMMRISHVIRGEEWLPSAPLHVLMYEAYGWEAPQFVHLPLLLKPDGKGKLSKRDGDRLGFPVFPLEWHDPKSGEISSGFRERGYLPEAVVNFLALLGWNPGDDREIFSMDNLIEAFSLDHCSKKGAKFDFEKAKWFNHEYLMTMPDDALARVFRPIVSAHVDDTPFTDDYLSRVVSLVKQRANLLPDLWEQSRFFFAAPDTYAEKDVRKRWKPETPEILTALVDVLAGVEPFTSEHTEAVVLEWIKEHEYHLGNVMNAFRLTVVGECKGPHMFDITALLGRDETIARLRRGIECIKPADE